jgi:hypothetical protein
MIAYALLAVIAANEYADRPGPTTMIAFTCNEIRRLLHSLVLEPAAPERARAPGQTGDDATNTAPKQATTDARTPPGNSRNDLRLEY